MRKAALITALILSILYLGGCVVVSSEEHRPHKHQHVECSPHE
ncbi:MAG: hypothetical protein ACYSWW_27800 [Planctomycetota bacterium]